MYIAREPDKLQYVGTHVHVRVPASVLYSSVLTISKLSLKFFLSAFQDKLRPSYPPVHPRLKKKSFYLTIFRLPGGGGGGGGTMEKFC